MSISAFDPTVGYKSASCISTINTKFDADGNTVESRSSTMGETSLSFDCSSLVPANSTIHWSWFYCGSVTVSGIYTTGKLWIHNTLIDTSGGELDLDNALSATVKLWFQAKNSVAGGPYTPTYAQTATFNNCYMEVYYTLPENVAPPSVTVSPTSVGPNGAATLSWGRVLVDITMLLQGIMFLFIIIKQEPSMSWAEPTPCTVIPSHRTDREMGKSINTAFMLYQH